MIPKAITQLDPCHGRVGGSRHRRRLLSSQAVAAGLMTLLTATAAQQVSAQTPWQGLFDPPVPLTDGLIEACDDFDFDLDGESEALIEDTTAAVGTLRFSNAGGVGPDVVHVGTAGGGRLVGTVDVDGDGRLEAIVTADSLAPGTWMSDAGAGGDAKVLWLGTAGGGLYLEAADFDGDGDPDLALFAASTPTTPTANLGSTGFDIIWLEVQGLSSRGLQDLDGDGDVELVLGDASLAPSTSVELDAENDGDPDVIRVGGVILGFADVDGDGAGEAMVTSQVPGVSQQSLGGGSGADLIFTEGFFVGTVDLDNDGVEEAVFNTPNAPASSTVGHSLSGSTTTDLVIAGFSGGGGAVGAADIDGDGEVELLVEDPLAARQTAAGSSLGGTSPDVLTVATQGGRIGTVFDYEGDGETEVLVVDPTLVVGAFDFWLLTWPNIEVFFVGSDGQSVLTLDSDGDGRQEAVLDLPSMPAGTRQFISTGGGVDVLFVGTGGAGRLAGKVDLDGDGDDELVIEAEGLASPVVTDGFSGDQDLIYIRTQGGMRVEASADLDGDGLPEVLVTDPSMAIGSMTTEEVFAGDTGVVFLGSGSGNGSGNLVGTADLDSDGDLEAVFEDPAGAGATSSSTLFPNAGHLAVVTVGTADDSEVACRADLDGDGESELLVDTPSLVGALGTDLDGSDTDIAHAGAGASSPITVLTPNGGETLTIAGFYDITWDAPQIAGRVLLELSRDDGVTWEEIRVRNNIGTHTWRVTGPGTHFARIRISAEDDGSILDESDAPFTIETPFLDITAPTAGDRWPIRERHFVNWTMTGIEGPTRLELSRDDGVTWQLIQENNANDGVRGWWAEGPPTQVARFRISSYWEPSYSAISDAFEIPVPQFTVTAPNGGENLTIGTSTTLTWSLEDLGGPVRIDLSRDGGTTWEEIDPGRPNTGQRPWFNIPGPATGGVFQDSCRVNTG